MNKSVDPSTVCSVCGAYPKQLYRTWIKDLPVCYDCLGKSLTRQQLKDRNYYRRALYNDPGVTGSYQRMCWLLLGSSSVRLNTIRNKLFPTCPLREHEIARAARQSNRIRQVIAMCDDLEAEMLARLDGAQ